MRATRVGGHLCGSLYSLQAWAPHFSELLAPHLAPRAHTVCFLDSIFVSFSLLFPFSPSPCGSYYVRAHTFHPAALGAFFLERKKNETHWKIYSMVCCGGYVQDKYYIHRSSSSLSFSLLARIGTRFLSPSIILLFLFRCTRADLGPSKTLLLLQKQC